MWGSELYEEDVPRVSFCSLNTLLIVQIALTDHFVWEKTSTNAEPRCDALQGTHHKIQWVTTDKGRNSAYLIS
jgi:hypothetical protein